jgi:FkbM family methyltransferase
MKIKNLIMKLLFLITGNKYAQEILEKIFYWIRILMGFGSGAFPIDSGEKEVFVYLSKLERRGNEPFIIFDVGANKGQFLQLLLDNLFVSDYKVFCFEPVKDTFRELEKNFGGLEKIVLINQGLDISTHEAKIYFDNPGSLRASKYHRDLRHLGINFSLSEDVQYTTLDQFCETFGVDYIDLLKIDVEGNEYNVLKGAEKLLENGQIKLITFEFGRAQIDSNTFFKDLYYYLKKFGLEYIYRIHPSGYLHPIPEYDEKNEVFFTTNYIAVMK